MASSKTSPRSKKPAADPDAIEGTARNIPNDTAPPEGSEVGDNISDIEIVVVQKIVAENGDISVNVQPQGVSALEVQTLLELAIPSWRQKIGLKA